MKLIRGYIPSFGVFGELLDLDGNHLAYSTERLWNNNISFQSCVPEGVYELKPYEYKGELETFALENKALNVQVQATHNRFVRWGCCFHGANWPHQLQGCIAPATEFMPLYNAAFKRTMFGGSSSGVALGKVLDYLHDSGDRTLEISHQRAVVAA
ncbi:DUF5675 family protein [Pleionea sediminis]|uniref:DUF5675 family protein n=1 Tax=Pleionea sediminis TaxID=2569479 RepID=UPI001186C7AF|nr:DUF5675 family protein [Pleionea sediminis]